jgi:uncharacterized protein
MKLFGARSRRPFHVLAKPNGPICNLHCHYCYYLDRKALFAGTRSFRMSDEVLEAFTRQHIEAQPAGIDEIEFAWQGGEPTLLGIDFFQHALALQAKYARPGVRIRNAIQTNGTLLDDSWGDFLARHGFLVGLSVDGPRELHDAHRVDGGGSPTFDRVMRGLGVLKRHRVEFNTLTVVHASNSGRPREVYDFLRTAGARHMQFIPLVESDGAGGVQPRSVGAADWGRFLNGVFDRWLERCDIGRVFVQEFEVTLALVLGLPSTLCTHAEECCRAVVVEHDGSVYSCDHFVSPRHRLGDLRTSPLAALLDNRAQRRFGAAKRETLPGACRRCEFLGVCNGGCPKDRLARTAAGEPGLNHLCPGFRLYYEHTLPVFRRMARCLRLGRPAADHARIEGIEAAMPQAAGGAPAKRRP